MKRGVLLGIIIAILVVGIGGTYLWFHYGNNNRTMEDNSLSEDQAQEVTDNLDTSDMNILIAYYSYSGNTEGMAQEIQNQVGGDLFQIERATDYNDLYTEAEEEINNGDRPGLASSVDNMDQYDVIFIGYPIWWDMPPAMINSFLESYDLTNKVVIPFCTSSSDGIENSMNSIRSSANGAAFLDGLRLSGGSASSESGQEEIRNWLNNLGIFNGSES